MIGVRGIIIRFNFSFYFILRKGDYKMEINAYGVKLQKMQY